MPHRSRHRVVGWVVALLAFALTAAGCGDDGGSDDGSSPEAFCDRAREVQELVGELAELDVEAEPETARARLTEVLDAVQDMLEVAPEEIAADAADVAAALEPLEEDLAEATTSQELRQVLGQVTEQTGARAGAAVNDRVASDC